VEQAPDHYALLAALEQRAGNYKEAAEIYQRLVGLQPGNGVWWMGLGITLEHLNQTKDAVMAYRRAASSGSLQPSVQKFVDSRIAALSQ
jgi:MSHA biogenesis protein MshN